MENMWVVEMDDECPVCYVSLTSGTVPPCGHEVCLKCLMSLRNRSCVICRQDLTAHFPTMRTPLPRRIILMRR